MNAASITQALLSRGRSEAEIRALIGGADTLRAGVDAALAPPPPSTVLPPLLEGSNGNHVCWPQSFVPRGTTQRMDGAVQMDGQQVVYRTDYTTGLLLDTYVIRAVGTRADDHNVPTGDEYADGGQLWVASGHGGDNLVHVAYIAPDGVMTMRDPITCSGTTTYPNATIDATGRAWMHVRAGSLNWVLRYSDDRGVTWSNEIVYLSGASLVYAYLRWSPTKAYGWGRYNSASADFGKPKPFEFDIATGEFSAGGIGLGKIDGTASASGNKLPFNLDTIPTLVTPPSGYSYDVLEHTEDGRRAVIIRVNTADIRDSQIEHWQVANVADRYDDAKYSKAVLTNFGARLGYNGFDAYPNLCYDRSSAVQGTRLFIASKITVPTVEPVGTGVEDRWIFERWDDTPGNNGAWTKTRLLSGSEAYDSISRPLGAYRADALTPFTLSRMRFITEYNAITDAKVEYFDTKKGRQGFSEEAVTALWVAQAGFEPTPLQRAIINCGFRDLQVAGLLTDNDAAIAWMNGMLAGAYPVSRNNAVNAIFAGMAADYVAETGQALPKVHRPLTLSYPTLPRVGSQVALTFGFLRPPSTVTVTTPDGQTLDASNGSVAWTPEIAGRQLPLSVTEKSSLGERTTLFAVDVQASNSPFFHDTLTDTSGVNLLSHVPEVGGGYTRRAHTPAGSATINGGGVIFSSSSGMQYQVEGALNADVRFEAEMINRGNSTNSPQLLVRCPTDNGDADVTDDDGYCVYWSASGNAFVLAARIDGVVTTLKDEQGNPISYPDTWSKGVTKRMAIIAHGDRITLETGGVIRGTAIDTTYPAAGRLNIRNSGSATGSSSGKVFLTLTATDLS